MSDLEKVRRLLNSYSNGRRQRLNFALWRRSANPQHVAKMASDRPTVIALEGLIGAGKSTLLNYLKDNFTDVLYIEEPVDSFQTYKSFNPLDLLAKNGFAAQYHIIRSLIGYYRKLNASIKKR